MRLSLALLVLVALLAGIAAWPGCTEQGDGNYCAIWCEMATATELEKLDDQGCELVDDFEEFEGECLEVCRHTIAHLYGSPADARVCIECVYGVVGNSPSDEQLQAALAGSCEDKCLEDGMTEFWLTFWDDWGFEDFEYECG